jgi:mannan endo-1,4-beta-mannosidase
MRPGILALLLLGSLAQAAQAAPAAFVRVQGARFERGGKPYRYVGANFWNAMDLGSSGPTGDRPRLLRELDRLQALGVTNLRLFVNSLGPETEPLRIKPPLQPEPGVLDPALLAGLDFALSELGKRGMTAVLCLNDFWHDSGGMAQYQAWAGAGSIPYPPPMPGGSFAAFEAFSGGFFLNPKAIGLSHQFYRLMIARTNSVTGVRYVDDPAILSWQLANEPRAMKNPAAFRDWLVASARLVRALDPNHLVSAGLEGDTPWPEEKGLDFVANHGLPEIDYATIHVWPQNFSWYQPQGGAASYASGLQKAKEYFDSHLSRAEIFAKPMVLEEFGLGRDGGSFDPDSPVTLRDDFYREMLGRAVQAARSGRPLAGAGFWAWSGEGRPVAPYGGLWKPGDPSIGDPPHEPQGHYGIYATDVSTQAIIAQFAREMAEL